MKTDKLLHLMQQKVPKRAGGGLPLPKAQTGSSVDFKVGPTVAKATSLAQQNPFPVTLPNNAVQYIDFPDNRVTDPVVKGKLLESTRKAPLFNIPREDINKIVEQAFAVGVDPATLIAIIANETKIGQTDEQLGHTLYHNTPTIEGLDEFSLQANLAAQALKEQLRLGKLKYPKGPSYKQLQSYQGYGPLTPSTEKDYYGHNNSAFFGIPVTKEKPLLTKKVFPYGKTIEQYRDSVITPTLDKYGINYKQTGGGLTKAQVGKSTYVPLKQTFQFSPMTEYEKEESSQPNLPLDQKESALYNYNQRNIKYNDVEQINKSKNDYFNYLDSPAYLATAKKMWGDDAILNIEKQKSKIQNTPIVPYWDMDLTDRIKIIQDPGNIAEYDPINKRILNYTGNDLVKKHELSHATDAKPYPSDMWSEEYSEDGDNAFITRKYNLNPKYNDVSQDYLLLDDDFKEWDKRFKSDGSHDSMPTEIRAYVNTLRQKMFADGIDWNNLNDDQILEYVKKYEGNKETDPELQYTIKALKNKEGVINTEKLKAIRDLAYNSNNAIKDAAKGGSLPKAQDGLYNKLLKYKESPDENKIEFVDPSGLTSWDDAVKGYDSWQKSSRTLPTFNEGMDMFSAVPILGKAKQLDATIQKLATTPKWALDWWKAYQAADYLNDEYRDKVKKANGGLIRAQDGTTIPSVDLKEVTIQGNPPSNIESQNAIAQKTNPKKNYAIVDKVTNRIYYYKPSGELIKSESIITGKSNNDVDKGLSMKEWFKQTGSESHDDYFKYLEENKYQTTPSGIFKVSGYKTNTAKDPSLLGRMINKFRPERAAQIRESRLRDYGLQEKMFTLSDENKKGSSKAIHGTNNPIRVDAFSKPNSDKNLSNGCVNVNGETICFDTLGVGSNIYIMPEEQLGYLYPKGVKPSLAELRTKQQGGSTYKVKIKKYK